MSQVFEERLLKRYCSVVDLKVGNVVRAEGEIVAVCKESTLCTIEFLGSKINLNANLRAIDVVDANVRRRTMYLNVFELVELIRG